MAERGFYRARRKADWKRIFAFVTGKPSLLLPFDLVRSQVVVKSVSYEGIREIELDRIIGSVNRYHDFDREFLPRSSEREDRWSRVRRVFDSDVGFPPIRVYQVGEAYFVVDGNHRVSVARQLGMTRIEAEVTRFQPNVPIDKTTSLSDLIVKKEYSDFLERTRLDELRPGQPIEITLPGRYDVLLEHIAKRRYFLGVDTGREIPYEEAVVSWYDGLYRPLIEIFRQERLLDCFPGRTEADLYVWVTRHLHLLRLQHGEGVGLVEATRDFVRASEQSASPRLRRRMRVAKTRASADRPGEEIALPRLRDRIRSVEARGLLRNVRYAVPSEWIDPLRDDGRTEQVDAPAFWRHQIEEILDTKPVPRLAGEGGTWTRHAIVYNLFVRASCAFDHDMDGAIHVLNRDGVRETGTFVKAIALLPYLRSLGCNVVHLFPITRIGWDGRKGSLGSPYAIANPYQLDESLSEPLLGVGPEDEFQAFVEAAHRLGIRVVLEFVFRTAAKDSEWVARHPEWFYWIRTEGSSSPVTDESDLGAPRFSPQALRQIKAQVSRGEFADLPAPDESFRRRFARPPEEAALHLDNGIWVGRTASGQRISIPGAFADWPPDDLQPPWRDVTYLRLFDHPEFNYMAYNTIRMYDERLARPEHAVADLWDRLAGILPHYQDRYGIDGAMIDMGHALPAALKRRIIEGARAADPTFALWEEEFTSRESTRREGYNAVAGNLWWSLHRPAELRAAIRRMAEVTDPLPVFATPETHNTPRCAARPGGLDRARCLWTLGVFLPAIPFVHSGFELGERIPVNTGLDFSEAEIAALSGQRLALYSEAEYTWGRRTSVRETIRRTLDLRRVWQTVVVNPDPSSWWIPSIDAAPCVVYARVGELGALVIIGNPNDQMVDAAVTMGEWLQSRGEIVDAFTGQPETVVSGTLRLSLAPWQTRVFSASFLPRTTESSLP
jgi:starch synthase (maltosyl-transferring)